MSIVDLSKESTEVYQRITVRWRVVARGGGDKLNGKVSLEVTFLKDGSD